MQAFDEELTLNADISLTLPTSRAYPIDEHSGVPPTSRLAYRLWKRSMDVALAGGGLIVTGGLFAVIAVAVRLSSPGPVLYREVRIGRYGKPFTILKFRSMHTREYLRDVLGHKVCAITEMRRRADEKHLRDPRITKIGAFLRRTSLDELPQLFNVLRGDMSLIGPRPVVRAELERYGEDARFYKAVYPGLTGLWQVSGRNDISYAERVRLDAEYSTQWSPALDLRILIRTLPVVFKGTGAY